MRLVEGVSPLRLNLLRGVYLLIGLGMGLQVWPQVVTGSGNWAQASGTVKCMFAALTLLALLGVRYPLKMLPLLFWELVWKTVWLLAILFPAWRSGTIDPIMAQDAIGVAVVVLVYAAMPWRYVVQQYARAPGEPWKASEPAVATAS